jgi:hypothetical protein
MDNTDQFGLSVSAMADSNDDGVGDLAVGANWDDDGGTDRGAFYVLFMASTGVVKSFRKVSDTIGSFTGIIFLSLTNSRIFYLKRSGRYERGQGGDHRHDRGQWRQASAS